MCYLFAFISCRAPSSRNSFSFLKSSLKGERDTFARVRSHARFSPLSSALQSETNFSSSSNCLISLEWLRPTNNEILGNSEARALPGWPCLLLAGLWPCSYFLIECVAAATSKAENAMVITERGKKDIIGHDDCVAIFSVADFQRALFRYGLQCGAHVYLHKHFNGNWKKGKGLFTISNRFVQ